jgi:6-phosphofructokinase 1
LLKSKPIILTSRTVDGIHLNGGTVLGTSKSRSVDIGAVVDKIELWNINHLYVIGGDGGQRAAQQIHELCQLRQLPCCVIGVPKSIENSILLIDRTFGFETAVEEAQRALEAGKVEASSSPLGVSIVRLMGRKSGWLAMQASLASGLVDCTLIPEVPFILYGPTGLLAFLDEIISKQGHAVICLSEGAGQDLLDKKNEHPHSQPFHLDSTGSPLMKDIGSLLRSRISHHLGPRADVTLIDTIAMIRTRPCHSQDHIYCRVLASNAVDAAFSAFSGIIVGEVLNHFCYLPIPIITQAVRRVDPAGAAWRATRSSMGQPSLESTEASTEDLKTKLGLE